MTTYGQAMELLNQASRDCVAHYQQKKDCDKLFYNVLRDIGHTVFYMESLDMLSTEALEVIANKHNDNFFNALGFASNEMLRRRKGKFTVSLSESRC